ncbi:MAG: acyl-CoA dehydrogenase family protein [Acidimicrobiaceae bacterium]|nr:acyl-CoA dehydrogenase family protein [Acidimicrobiaceae bacterium]
MTSAANGADAGVASPVEEAIAFRQWLADHHDEFAHLRVLHADADERVRVLKELQARLYDAGWARLGWPSEIGGRGGNILHRAAIYEELANAGYPPRFVFEHLEVLLPSLARFGDPALMTELLPRMLSGEETWSQGFSEPGAGSDFAAVRTRATQDGDNWIINGHKIWTSWSKWAKRCLLVARTGSFESRHRGLSVFVVDLEAPGVTVSPINQSNGSPELAEVFFDDVTVGSTALVGEINDGWTVAMYLLSCERGSFAWQRNTFLTRRLTELAERATDPTDIERLGNSVADLFAMRVRSWSTMLELAADGSPGPQSAVNKALLTDAEQYLFHTADRIHPGGFMWAQNLREEVLQEELLFSHAASIYGGTRQIQNITVYRQLVAGHTRTETDEYVETAMAAMLDPAGAEAGLDTLGFDEVVGDLGDTDNRRAIAAVFEAAGRTAQPTTGLARLLESLLGGDTTLAVATEHLADAEVRLVVDVNQTTAPRIVLATPRGWVSVLSSDVTWNEATQFLAPGNMVTGVVDISEAPSFDAAVADRAEAVGRWALACEALGAVDAMFDAAVNHAAEREQFGATLNSFQAVQFMLAESHIACTALREACSATGRTLNGDAAMITKLLAGRIGRRVGAETLQVLGAIGFTQEHPHHGWFHRVLTIDALLGRSAALARELGTRLVRTGKVPLGVDLSELPGASSSA